MIKKLYVGHKNVKAFLTHGGLLGTQEAIYYEIPLIGIPLCADQFFNINNYVKKKTKDLNPRLMFKFLEIKKFI